MISGKTRTAGLIGENITHSLSPHIHNYLAKSLSCDLVYTCFNVRPQDLEAAIKGAHALGIAGLNITAPHKTAAMNFAVAVDESAAEVDSTNLLKYTKLGYLGFNTDVYGILCALEYHGVMNSDNEIKDATIFGAGGAARAAIAALSSLGCQNLTIVNRSKNNAKKLLHFAKEGYHMNAKTGDKPREGDLLIQASAATPAQLLDQIPKADFDAIFDMNYPKDNIWLKQLKSPKINTFDGIAMLVFQAVKSFEILSETTVSSKLTADLLFKLNKYIQGELLWPLQKEEESS
jgi:shikimate dehydrogenase